MTKAFRRRGLASAAATLGVMIGGASAAWAFSWGTLSVYDDGNLQGQGYGKVASVSGGGIKLYDVYLRDVRTGGGRTYGEANATGSDAYVRVKTGLRSDGGSSFALMAEKTAYAGVSSTAGWYTTVKVCQEKGLLKPNPCTPSGSQATGRL
ncbi:MAG: hypothetical protein U0Q15_01535 [Kineosporiaceae bacterium]